MQMVSQQKNENIQEFTAEKVSFFLTRRLLFDIIYNCIIG